MMGVVVKILLAVYMLLILFLSLRPGSPPLPGVWQIDKLYHLFAYALMGFLWVCALAPAAVSRKGVFVSASQTGLVRQACSVRVLLAAFVICTFYGAVMEILQQFSPSREADIFDAAANGLGALIGVAVAGRTLSAFGR